MRRNYNVLMKWSHAVSKIMFLIRIEFQLQDAVYFNDFDIVLSMVYC